MNVKNLFKKDMRFAFLPTTMLFALMSAMLLIPSYPYGVGFIYFFFIVQLIFQLSNEKKDMEFTLTLPVTRREIVISKHLMIILAEAIYLILSIPFAIVSNTVINKGQSNSFLDANLTLYGVVIILYGLFNLIFFTSHFETGKKLSKGLLWGIISMLALYALAEAIFILFLPIKVVFDGVGGEYLFARLIFLVLSIVIFIVLNIISINISTKKFAKAGV